MKKFLSEFKKFITRGNVVDLAVGVIIGSSFTAIVNGLSNFVLKPVINWIIAMILGKDSLSELMTFLVKVEKTENVVDANGIMTGTKIVPDLEQSIYIDWGAFINAIINFFLIALVLFTIVKIINRMRADHSSLREKIADGYLNKAERKELKAHGISLRDREAIIAYFDEKEKRLAEEAAEAARIQKEQNPTTEDLLKQILAEMKKS